MGQGDRAHLVCAILADALAGRVLDALAAAGHRATRASSTGGFIRRGNTTLLIGVEREQLEAVLAVIRETCGRNPPSVEEGRGATVFVLEVERLQHT